MKEAHSWKDLELWFAETFKMEADVDAMLFMIGVQELGKGFEVFNKTQKMELIHVGICTVFSKEGYYRLSHIDVDGWPHFDLIKKLPVAKANEQAEFIKKHLLVYFNEYITV